jgi:hypothetical protein
LYGTDGRQARLVLTLRFILGRDARGEETELRSKQVDKETIELLARRAGLAKALAEFPEDVAISARQAADVAQKIRRPADPTAEPWPPMRAGIGL